MAQLAIRFCVSVEIGRALVDLEWMECGNCVVEDVGDQSFIRPPRADEAVAWLAQCKGCDVLEECRRWATTKDENGFTPSGVWAAGEWRE